jgi:hypothetical protein
MILRLRLVKAAFSVASARSLTQAERALRASFSLGATVDLRTGDPVLGDLAQAGRWGPGHTVRAVVIADLLLGAGQLRPGSVAAVRLFGARITGCLDLADGQIAFPLELADCLLEEKPELGRARTRTIRLTRCSLPGFDGSWMQVDGHLFVENCDLRGTLELYGAHVTGEVVLNATKVRAPRGPAVWANGLTIDHAFRAQDGFACTGEFLLRGATVRGSVFFEGATLSNRDGYALAADGLTVGQTMQCSQGFAAEGTLRLRGARIGGTLSFDHAVLRAPRTALQLGKAVVAELILTPAEPIEGAVSFRSARIEVMSDDPATWPPELRISGLVYDHIRSERTTQQVSERLDWISRDPAGYLPQPYEQLATWFRRIGHDDDARRVLLAKQRHRRSTLSTTGRIWGHALDWTVGYGYRPWLAGLWLLGLLALGTTLFSVHNPAPTSSDSHTDFNAFSYTIDLLMPVSLFGQRQAWNPHGPYQWFAYSLIAAGWILATALIAGITRVLTRN